MYRMKIDFSVVFTKIHNHVPLTLLYSIMEARSGSQLDEPILNVI